MQSSRARTSSTRPRRRSACSRTATAGSARSRKVLSSTPPTSSSGELRLLKGAIEQLHGRFERGVTRIVGENGIKARPNLKDKLALKCWALREARRSRKAIAANLGLVSEWSVRQLICRNRRGLEAEIAGLEAEDAKLRRLVGAKERTQPRSKSMACQASNAQSASQVAPVRRSFPIRSRAARLGCSG